MSNILDDTLRSIWQQQPVTREQIALQFAQSRFSDLQRWTVTRNRSEIISCLLIVAWITFEIWFDPRGLFRTVIRVYFIAVCVWICAVLWQSGRVRDQPLYTDLLVHLNHVIDAHTSQLQLMTEAVRWYWLPIVFGMALLMAEALINGPIGLWPVWSVALGAMAVVGYLLYRTTRKKLEEFAAELADLRTVRDEVVSGRG